MRQRTYYVGIISLVLICIGSILRVFHLPGASLSLSIGVLLFVAGFAVLFAIDKVSLERKSIGRASQIALTVAMVLVLLSTWASLMRMPAHRELTLLSIIGFTIYLVFFTRYTEGRKLKLQKDRQLACILFTDIVGFTEMMGQDEDHTLKVLDKNRTLQKRLIRQYRGRWIKEMGDGALAIFFTASEAVQCALEIQKLVQTEKEFKVRMGLHISEIFFTDNDIFGDGVNVASRICSLAGANEIFVSSIVFQNIKNREELNIESIGLQKLKNVIYELEVFKILT